MKTRLLKRLRREAKKQVVIYKDRNEYFPYAIIHTNKEGLIKDRTIIRTLDEAKGRIEHERRKFILREIKKMRIERENKQLRKL